jgi:DNA-binding NtrC family response regulator
VERVVRNVGKEAGQLLGDFSHRPRPFISFHTATPVGLMPTASAVSGLKSTAQSSNSSRNTTTGLQIGLAFICTVPATPIRIAVGARGTTVIDPRRNSGDHGGMSPPVAQATKARAIIVDDDPEALAIVGRALRDDGFEVRSFPSGGAALEGLETVHGDVEVVFTDLHMPEMNGLQLASTLRERWPEIVVVMITGGADVSSAMQAMRLGVYDYLIKPIDVEATLLPIARRAVEYRRLLDRNRYLQRQLDISARFEGMVGTSPAMRTVHELIAAVAPTQASVLILGESGTGKELVARAIQEQSPRSGKPFVTIDCSALAESVLESELFGHVRGAFTGAVASRRGLFEEASGGTIFLDEIGELTSALQMRLLRALQEGKIRPVGSNESRDVDVRVIAATNRDLEKAVREQTFRQDLYYRLNVMTIHVPPLRDRMEDLVALARHFLEKHGTRLGKLGKIVKHIEPAAIERMMAYAWPGNVRELEHAIEHAVILTRTEAITEDGLPQAVRTGCRPISVNVDSASLPPLAEARAKFEREYVRVALEQAGGNLTEAARIAGVDRSNFRRMVKRLRGDGG